MNRKAVEQDESTGWPRKRMRAVAHRVYGLPSLLARWLEPCDSKESSTVLKGERGRETPDKHSQHSVKSLLLNGDRNMETDLPPPWEASSRCHVM